MLVSSLRPDLCLSYVNTLCWRGVALPVESLHDLAGLLGWLEVSACLDGAAARGCRRWAASQPERAALIFTEAIALREALYRMFAALAAGKSAGRRDRALLQRALAAAPPRRLLVAAAGGYAWRIARPQPSVAHLLGPVLWSAADLLVAGDRQRLRQCANDKCRWLFLDRSRNATRRWCDMAACGNRAKAHRHYLRTKNG
jgi:predicted RNA-binding Zn ribbon-like protein